MWKHFYAAVDNKICVLEYSGLLKYVLQETETNGAQTIKVNVSTAYI